MADTDCASESASSVCDEERVRRLFQACDANGDGFIDSHDLLTICRELSLEDSLDELMYQLGADSQGRISYEQFLQRRLALRPEIDALKNTKLIDNASDNSQGKLDSWEWDSGARDMSPVPKPLGKKVMKYSEETFKFLKGPFRLAGTDLPTEGGGVTNCLTTYVFNPVDTCTGTPSPEKLLLKTPNYELKHFPPPPAPENASETLVSPQSVAYDRKSLGHCNYMAEYDLNLKVCQFGEEHKKCCVGGHYGPELSSFGHLYTISGVNGKEERTYDEPYAGDLPRRSWLCCPGSQQHAEGDQPPLLANNNTPSTPGETITKGPMHGSCHGGCEKLQEQLDEQAQRYEEQLTELHSVIAELTRKLHQQRSMAIAEEDEVSEGCTDIHDDSLTCPLEVSELEPAEHDLSDDIDTKIPLADSPLELPEPKLTSSNHENNELSPYLEIVEPLKQEIASLKAQLSEAHGKLALIAAQGVVQDAIEETVKILESPDSHIEVESDNARPYKNDKLVDMKYSNIVPIHKGGSLKNGSGCAKISERIKLKRSADSQRDVMTPTDLLNSDLPTTVAEHIMSDILQQCNLQNDKQAIDIEFKRLTSKLEHTRSQNSVLALTLSETKAHCDRLALLCGKYESNAVALRLALGVCDRAIEAYDVLLALLETELSLSENSSESLENRTAAETVAKQLLAHLDSFQNTDVLLSPWQNHMYNSPTSENDEPWTTEHENRLREHVSRLKAERSNIQGTYVTLESTQVENAPIRPSCSQEARKVDLEMAVLMQELMSLREDKAELMSKLFVLEKEKSTIELKLKYVEGQQKAQSAALKNLQGQLKDTEALLALATQNKERGYSDAEHAQGVELELMQALAREARLKVRLQELVSTLEQVTKNAEARLLEGREIVHDLNHTNSILAETVDRNNKKYQAKFKRMEQQMLQMVERHTTQVQTLQQRIASLETPPTNSSENSMSSLAI